MKRRLSSGPHARGRPHNVRSSERLDPRPDGGACGTGTSGRLLRQSGHWHSHTGRQSHSRRRRSDPSVGKWNAGRSEEHTSELQSLMRISYAVFCLKKKKQITKTHTSSTQQKTTNN